MVAMNVWPTDAADGSVASEARWRKMARHWAPTGVCPGIGSEMAMTLAFPNLTVKAGAAWVDGHFCELPGDQVLAVTANGNVVVRFDPAANTAQLLYLDGVTGPPSQSPSGTYELCLAQVIASTLQDLRPLGSELRYGQITSNVVVNAITAAGANQVIAPGGTFYDGTPIMLEFFAATVTSPAVVGSSILINLWDNNTDLGFWGQTVNPAAANFGMPMLLRRRLIPTPGAHGYNVRAWVAPSGSGTVFAGNGTVSNPQPAYLRVTRAL